MDVIMMKSCTVCHRSSTEMTWVSKHGHREIIYRSRKKKKKNVINKHAMLG